jgi:hypothetical protein
MEFRLLVYGRTASLLIHLGGCIVSTQAMCGEQTEDACYKAGRDTKAPNKALIPFPRGLPDSLPSPSWEVFWKEWSRLGSLAGGCGRQRRSETAQSWSRAPNLTQQSQQKLIRLYFSGTVASARDRHTGSKNQAEEDYNAWKAQSQLCRHQSHQRHVADTHSASMRRR